MPPAPLGWYYFFAIVIFVAISAIFMHFKSQDDCRICFKHYKGYLVPENNDFVKISVGENVSAGHFQCRKMLLKVTFILAIDSAAKESSYKTK